MIEIADKQLYISKESGRDKVTLINTLEDELMLNSINSVNLATADIY